MVVSAKTVFGDSLYQKAYDIPTLEELRDCGFYSWHDLYKFTKTIPAPQDRITIAVIEKEIHAHEKRDSIPTISLPKEWVINIADIRAMAELERALENYDK